MLFWPERLTSTLLGCLGSEQLVIDLSDDDVHSILMAIFQVKLG